MALEYNSNLYPPLGFTFKEADGTKFRGTSWPDVEAKVTAYRTQHGKPAGDVHADVMAQTCKSSPSYCRDTNGQPAAKVSPRTPKPDAPRGVPYIPPAGGGNVVLRVTNWVSRLLTLKRKSQIAYVPKGEARRRASICASCPKQTPVHGSCGGCMSSLKVSKGLILNGIVPVEKYISGCIALGEDTSVSVHIVQTPAPAAGLPANCWRKDQ